MERERKGNAHQAHRQRMRERILNSGLDSLADHEVLEVLLYYALPRRDTNVLAHELLDKYGSLSAVLEADYLDLVRQEGIGPNSAFLLKFTAKLAARYVQDKNRSRPVYGSTQAFVAYVGSLFVSEVREVAYLLCLDNRLRLINAVKLGQGTVDAVMLPPAEVVRHALNHLATNVVLAHNHPGGSAKPSDEDLRMTWKCLKALESVNITLLDHLIICDQGYFSFLENNYMAAVRAQYK